MKDSYTTELPKDIKPEDFVESVKDASDVTLEFVGQDSWEKKGKYGVTVFATDSEGGLIGTIGSTTNLEGDSPICYINKNKKCFLIANDFKNFLERTDNWKNNLEQYNEIIFYG